jgi:hypothetical protein
MAPGCTKNRYESIIILFRVCIVVTEVGCLQDLSRGTVKLYVHTKYK